MSKGTPRGPCSLWPANTLTEPPPFLSLKIAILDHVGPILVPRCCNMDARWPKMTLISLNMAQLSRVLANFGVILASSWSLQPLKTL